MDKCPKCESEMKCLSGSSHPLQGYCSDKSGCGYQAWTDNTLADRKVVYPVAKERKLSPLEQQVMDARMEKQLAVDENPAGRYEYTMIKKAIIYASTPGKMNDTIRLELLDGRIITVQGKWGSAVVSDSSEESH